MGVSITEIAQAAGVSPTTVSRALNGHGYVNEATKEKILKIADSLDYRPKKYRKHKASSDSNIIGVIVPDIENSFFAEIICGIENVVTPKGYDLFICDSHENSGNEIRCLSALYSRNICGLIIAVTSDVSSYNTEYLINLNSSSFPVVLVDRSLHASGLDSVTLDNLGGAYNAVETLIKNGHRDIAILCGPTTLCTGIDRLNGYMEALRKYEIPIKEEYILYGDFMKQSGYALTKKLLSNQRNVTAIFSCNRRMTIGCLQALDELNVKVPDDIALIAFGSLDSISIRPGGISHVTQPVKSLGEEAAQILLVKHEMGNKYRKAPCKQSIYSSSCVLHGSEVYPTNRKKK